MKRRNFLAALAATPLGALLALGESDVASDVTRDLPRPKRDTLRAMEDALNRTLGPLHDVRIRLRRKEDRPAIMGEVASTTSLHRAWFRCGFWEHRHLPSDGQAMMVIRQIKYQAKKAAESVAYTRRTGYVMRVVEREGHRLNGRIYWRHEMTGRIRWSRPA